MKKNLLFSASLACVLALSACATPQKLVQDNGWIPLDSLNMVKFTPVATSSANCGNDKRPDLLGEVFPYGPLNEQGIFYKIFTLIPNRLVLEQKLDFETCYSHGPDKVFDAIDYTIKLSEINIGSVVNAGLQLSASSDVQINKVWHVFASMNQKQQLRLLQALDTPDEKPVFLVTSALIGDISNSEQVFLSGGGRINAEHHKFNVDVIQVGNTKKTETLAGLSLALGVKGNIVRKTDVRNIPPFAVPDVGQTTLLEISDDLRLRIVRMDAERLEFRLNGGAAANVFERVDNQWEKDESSTIALNGLSGQLLAASVSSTRAPASVDIPRAAAVASAPSAMPSTTHKRDLAMAEIAAVVRSEPVVTSATGAGSPHARPSLLPTVAASSSSSVIQMKDVRVVSTSLAGDTSDVISLTILRDPSNGKMTGEGRTFKILSQGVSTVNQYLAGLSR
jgi:hypothetical protein